MSEETDSLCACNSPANGTLLGGGGGYGINIQIKEAAGRESFAPVSVRGVSWSNLGYSMGPLLHSMASLLSFGCFWGCFSDRGETSHPKVPVCRWAFTFPPVKGPPLP